MLLCQSIKCDFIQAQTGSLSLERERYDLRLSDAIWGDERQYEGSGDWTPMEDQSGMAGESHILFKTGSDACHRGQGPGEMVFEQGRLIHVSPQTVLRVQTTLNEPLSLENKWTSQFQSNYFFLMSDLFSLSLPHTHMHTNSDYWLIKLLWSTQEFGNITKRARA